MKQEAQLPQK